MLLSFAVGTLLQSGSLLASLDSHRNVPFSLSGGHFIVVRGAVGSHPLHFVIDTGASHSVIDTTAAADIGLTPLTESVTVHAFGRTVQAGRVIVSGLSLGPARTSLACLVVDLPWSGIDGILGLDFLRRRSLTIDFENKSISFGRELELESRVSFVPDSPLVLVAVQLKGQDVLLSVDTGSPEISLFEDSRFRGGRRMTSLRRQVHRDLAGEAPVRHVQLPTVQMGDGRWLGLRGTLRSRRSGGRDGVLGVASLNLKRIHFEFEHGVLSWDR